MNFFLFHDKNMIDKNRSSLISIWSYQSHFPHTHTHTQTDTILHNVNDIFEWREKAKMILTKYNKLLVIIIVIIIIDKKKTY